MQQFKLPRLEIALLNLLSSFGYSRQGYPGPRDGANEANDYTLIKFFMSDQVEHHVYALSMMGYLGAIAEEWIGASLETIATRSTNESIMPHVSREENAVSLESAVPSEVPEVTTAHSNVNYPPSAQALLSQHVSFTRRSSVPASDIYTKGDATTTTPNDLASPTIGSGFGAVPLCPIAFQDGSMFESSDTTIVVDYANEYFGGPSTLTSTQEEILLMLKPEMLPGRQLCEVMLGHEAIVVDDARLFCSVTGYGRTTRIADVFPSILNPSPTPPQTNWSVPVIDAVVHRGTHYPKYNQYTAYNKLRCTHKAFLAFEHFVSDIRKRNLGLQAIIAGGRWGCGVFNGDLKLKVMQQWVAASAAGADRLVLFLFNDPLQPKIEEFVATWKDRTVGDAFRQLLETD